MKRFFGKAKILSWIMVVLFVLQSVAFAEEATLKYSYGSEAFNKHMLDLNNTTVYNGAKWVFEQGAFGFEGDFTMNGGNTGTVYECEVPEFRRQAVLPGQNLYLGRVSIRPSENMDLYVFSGDRTTGRYVLTDMQMNIQNYMLDITSTRDENGTFRLIDKVFLYAYEQNGTRKNYAASLYVSFENYEAASADTSPENAVISDTGENKTSANENAEGATLEIYAQMIAILEKENEELLDQIALLQTKVSNGTQSDELVGDLKAELEICYSNIEKLTADIEALTQEKENAWNMTEALSEPGKSISVHPDDGKPMSEIIVTALPETAYLMKNPEKENEWFGWDVTFSIRNESDVPFTPQFAVIVYYNGEEETTRAVLTYEEMRPHMGNDRLIKGNDPLEWGFGMTELENTHMTFTILGTDENGHQIEAMATAVLLNETKEDAEAEVQKLKNQLETFKAIVQEREEELEICYSNIEKLTADNAELTKRAENAESMKEEIEALNKVISDQSMTIEGYSAMVEELKADTEALKAESRKGARLLTDPETEVSALGKPKKAQPVREKAAQNEYSSNAHNERTAQLEAEIAALNTQIAEKEAAIYQMSAEFENAVSALQEKENAVSDEKTDYTAYSLEALSGVLTEVRNEIESRAPVSEKTPYDDFVYASNGTEISIRGYRGTDTEVVIPDEIDGLPVTMIGSSAFENNGNIVSVHIPDTVREIGFSAFYNCRKLKTVNIPIGLEKLGGAAFGYTALEGVLVFPETTKEIGSGSFINCNLTGIVILGDCVIEDGNTISNIKSMEFIYVRPGARVSIEGAIDRLPNLTRIVLPDTAVLAMDDNDSPFWSCPMLTIYTPEGSSVHKKAMEFMLPVNNTDYEKWDAYYDSLY